MHLSNGSLVKSKILQLRTNELSGLFSLSLLLLLVSLVLCATSTINEPSDSEFNDPIKPAFALLTFG